MFFSGFRAGRLFLILPFVLPFAGCGGGGTGVSSRPPPPPPPPAITVQLSITSIGLAPGAQQQFTAVVKGTTNTSVTWSVDGVAGGKASAGIITAAGLYTPPPSAA